MIWGGISLDKRTNLMRLPGSLNAPQYIDFILKKHIIPAAYSMRPNFVLKQNNEGLILGSSQ